MTSTTHTPARRATRRPVPRAAALLTALLLGLTACAGGSGGGDAASSDAEAPEAVADGRGLAYAADEDAAMDSAGGSTASRADTGSTGSTGETTLREPAIISSGTVSLRADDVADARFEVQKIVDRLGGQVTDSETSTDEDGGVRDARLVLRVPSSDFTEAIDALEAVADLEASSTS